MSVRHWLERKTDELNQRNAGNVLAAMSVMSTRQGTYPNYEHDWHYVLDVMRVAKLHAGAFYMAIEYLEARGAVEAKWAPGPYPRRRMYRITTREQRDA